VVYGVLAVGGVGEELLEFGDEAVRVAEIEGTEVSKEGLVHEVAIDAKVVGIGLVARSLLI
jgi:hypothetical protein